MQCQCLGKLWWLQSRNWNLKCSSRFATFSLWMRVLIFHRFDFLSRMVLRSVKYKCTWCTAQSDSSRWDLARISLSPVEMRIILVIAVISLAGGEQLSQKDRVKRTDVYFYSPWVSDLLSSESIAYPIQQSQKDGNCFEQNDKRWKVPPMVQLGLASENSNPRLARRSQPYYNWTSEERVPD